MVDLSLSGLGHAAIGQIKHIHNAAKNIETAHLGKLYTTAVENFDLHVVEGFVKPFLNKHPEITDNGAITFVKENRKISIISGACLFVLFLILLHPNREPRPPEDKKPASDIDLLKKAGSVKIVPRQQHRRTNSAGDLALLEQGEEEKAASERRSDSPPLEPSPVLGIDPNKKPASDIDLLEKAGSVKIVTRQEHRRTTSVGDLAKLRLEKVAKKGEEEKADSERRPDSPTLEELVKARGDESGEVVGAAGKDLAKEGAPLSPPPAPPSGPAPVTPSGGKPAAVVVTITPPTAPPAD